MQNRYTGDIGDFAKYGILRAITDTSSLGVAWYRYPDEGHNKDGKHTDYLNAPARWRHLDPQLFDALGDLVRSGARSLRNIEESGILPGATFSRRLLDFDGSPAQRRAKRSEWFRQTREELNMSGVVFADPDNGLCEAEKFSGGLRAHWKRMPITEALDLASRRTAIIYHHNTRRPGGHALEIQHWLEQLCSRSFALYWRPYSPRTFFVINPTAEMAEASAMLAERWGPFLEIHQKSAQRGQY